MPGRAWSYLGTGATPAARGRAFFEIDCAPCHGPEGRGGRVGWHSRAKRNAGLPVAKIIDQVRRGSKDMPPFARAALGDADLAQVAAYAHDTLGHPPRGPERPTLGPRALDPATVGVIVAGVLLALCAVLALLFGERRS